MTINKDLVKNQYLDFFIEEHKHVNERIKSFKNNGTMHNINKLKHLYDRLDAATRVISGNFDMLDLVTQDLFSAIWGVSDRIDRFETLRDDINSPLCKVHAELVYKELKHLKEYGKDELKYVVDMVIKNDPSFYLLTNNLKVGNA